MTLAHDVAEPLYLQIKDMILAEIERGTYAAHQRLPSERELSIAHGVSRMTVRQALIDLQRSGVIYARVGKGTFVGPRRIDQQLRLVTSFTREVRDRGGAPASRVLRAEVAPAEAELATVLGIAPSASTYILARVRLADGQPLAIETASVPEAVAPGLLRHDFSRESLYEVLTTEYRLDLVAASQTITAGLADEEECRLLGLTAPAAVLRMRRLTRTTHGTPIEFVVSAYRGDRYQLVSNLEPAETIATVAPAGS